MLFLQMPNPIMNEHMQQLRIQNYYHYTTFKLTYDDDLRCRNRANVLAQILHQLVPLTLLLYLLLFCHFLHFYLLKQVLK